MTNIFTIRIFLSIFCFLLFSCNIYSQNFSWVKEYYTMDNPATAKKVAVDESGNSYITGWRIFDTGGQLNEVFIVKRDPNGNLVSGRSFRGNFRGGYPDPDAKGYNIAVDNNENYYVVGSFRDNIKFDTTTLTTDSWAGFATKFAANGAVLWAIKTISSASGIAVDDSGNVYLNIGGVTKYNSNGSVIWSINVPGASSELAVDANGNCYVIGSFSGTQTFGSSEIISAGSSDIYIAKINEDGAPLWAVSAGGITEDSGTGIAVDSSGNIYTTGIFNGTATFETTVLTSYGGQDIFIAKYSSDGGLIWATKAGGSATDYSSDISIDISGNSYITGYFAGTATFGTTTLTSYGGNDIFVAICNGNGDIIGAINAGGTSNDVGNGISSNSNGICIATGNIVPPATFESIVLPVSDPGIFTTRIHDADITITSPNGGENWRAETLQEITWTSENVSNVKLEYTTNNGTSWIDITMSTPASSGIYYWTIPNSPSNDCKVRVSDVINSFVNDVSDSNFIISPFYHYTPIWSGNPYLPMNIYITEATVDGLNLGAGDEIGVFDGDVCVGSIFLSESIPSGGYVQVIASTDDPTTPEIDGFIAGNNIVYKFWYSNSQSEIIRITPTYSNGNGAFISQGTAVVELYGIYTTTQHTGLISGWNILSLMTIPDEPNMLQLLDPLIAADVLIKVQDEAGNAVEQLPPPIGWINNIGDWEPTEGYYTKLKPNSAATLSVTGPLVSLPLNIPLTNGWNIMGYPVPSNQNALDVLQPLISSNQLIKVQDQAGNAVEQLPPPIGWINNIGNFRAGEGYYIKVNENTALTLNQPTLKRENKDNWWLESNKPLSITTVHFTPVWSGNGYLIMNIYVTGVDLIGGGGLSAGDEIAVFDGEYCVGAVLITEPIPPGGFVQIKASTDDPLTPERDGFLSGNSIIYKFWLSATSEEIDEYTANYETGFSGIFQSQGTTLVNFSNVLPVELISFTGNVKNNQILLSWQTATEINNYGFEIERKIKDQEWLQIGFIEGHGNSNSPKTYSYTDNTPIGGNKFQYRLKQIDSDGKFEYSDVIEVNLIPTEFALYQNYPNPFNPKTTIRYQLPKESKVIIKIYNILGAEVLELLNEKKEPGIYEVDFNADNLSSGAYIYRIVADNFSQNKKMILLK